jgi:hypothetical protein
MMFLRWVSVMSFCFLSFNRPHFRCLSDAAQPFSGRGSFGPGKGATTKAQKDNEHDSEADNGSDEDAPKTSKPPKPSKPGSCAVLVVRDAFIWYFILCV